MAKLNTDSATKLYNAVKDAGFDIGDYNAYMTKLQSDPTNADNLYKALHGAGFDIGNDYASRLYSNATPIHNLFDFGKKPDVTIPNAGNGYSFLDRRQTTDDGRRTTDNGRQTTDDRRQTTVPLSDAEAQKTIYGNVPGTTKIGDVSFLPTGGGYQNTKGKAPVQKPNTDVQVAVPGQSVYGNAPQVKMPTITSEDIEKQDEADLQKQYAGNAYEQAMFKQAQDISRGVREQEFNPQFYTDIPRGAVNATVGIAGSTLTGVGDLYYKAGSLSGIDFYADYGKKLKELGEKADNYVKQHSTGSTGEQFGGMLPMAGMAVADIASGGSLTPVITGTFAASGYGDGIKMYDELHPNGDGNEYAKTGAGLLYGAVMAGAGNYLMGKAIPKGLISEAVQSVFRSNPELLQTGGEAIVNAFAKQQPTLLKQLATNAGHSVMSIEAMELGKKGIDELYGKHSDVKDWINTATHAAVTGVVFSALTAPFSMQAQSAANTARRNAQGSVTLTFDGKGKPVEVIEGLRGLTPEGKEVKLTQENVNNSFTMTTDDFNRFMAEKGNAEVNDREVFSNNVADTLKRMSGNGNVSVARDENGEALYVVGRQDGQLMGFDVEGQVRPIPEGADIQTAPMADVHSAIMAKWDEVNGSRQQTADIRQQTADNRQQTAVTSQEEILQKATADATNFVGAITHAESGNVIEARLHGVDKPINITKGNVVLKEDGSVDMENSDKTFFYKTPDGVLHVGNIEFIEGINSVVPAQEAIDKSVQPVREQLENENAPEYNPGSKAVIVDNTDPQNPSNAIVTITGRDENGNYKVQRDMGNGQVQPGIVQPREILPQFAGVLDTENAAVDYIDPQTGETMTGMLELDTPDKQMMFANGYATIDARQISFENVVGEDGRRTTDNGRQTTDDRQQITNNTDEANGLQAAEAGNAQSELGQGRIGTSVQEGADAQTQAGAEENGQLTVDNGQLTEIPVDDKGNLLFEQARPEMTVQFLKDNFEPEEIVPTVVARINAINKEISKQEAFKPTGNIQKDALTKQAKREALNALNEQLGYWKDIQEQVTPRNYKPQNETVAQRDARWGEPTSLREMIIRKFIGGVKLRWDDETSADGTVISRGLGGEYRYSNDERKAHFNFIAANGVTPEQLAHALWQANAYEAGQFEDMPLYGTDTQEILNEILDVMNSYKSVGDMIKSVDEIRDRYNEQEQAYIDALVSNEENQKNVLETVQNEMDDATFAQISGVVDLTEEQQNELKNLQNDDTNRRTTETTIGSDSATGSQQPGEASTGVGTSIANGAADAGGNNAGDRGTTTVDQSTVNSQQSAPQPPNGGLNSQAEIDTQELDANIASQEHNTNPTEKQKETGIYPKARVNLQGFNITLETLKGTERSGIDEGGQKWSVTMNNHYGELDGTTGYDGDPIDVFIGPNPKEGGIFVVDQTASPSPSGLPLTPSQGGGIPIPKFDESKVMLGFDSAEEAKAAYLSNYEPGWDGFGAITPAGDNFKEWLYDGKKQRKPFSEYVGTPEAVDNGQLTVSSEEKVTPIQKQEQKISELESKLFDLKLENNSKLFGGQNGSKGASFRSQSSSADKKEQTLKDRIEKEKSKLEEMKNALSSSDNEERAAFQIIEKENPLIVLHNITPEKLIKTNRIGGIAMPSLAITKAGSSFENYGTITLIGDKSIIDPKDKKNKVYPADAYTPRYPTIEYNIKNTSPIKKAVEGMPSDISRQILYGIPNSIERDGDAYLFENTDMVIMFAHSKGADIFENEKINKPKELVDYVRSIEAYDFRDIQDNKLIVNELQKLYRDTVIGDKLKFYKRHNLVDENGDADIDLIKDEFNNIKNFLRKEGKTDYYQTRDNARDFIAENKLQGELKQFSDLMYDEMNVQERIFKGRSRTGSPQYMPHTAENALKHMKTKLLAGEEGLSGGLGKLRAKLLPLFKSIQDIKNSSNKIVDTATLSSLSNKVHEQYQEYYGKLLPYYKWKNNPSIVDFYTNLEDEIVTLLRNGSSESFDQLPMEQLEDLRNFGQSAANLPTEYFEAKPVKVISLSEFTAAVVPQETEQKVIDILENSGLKVERYSDNRSDVVKRVAEENNAVFQIKPEAFDNATTPEEKYTAGKAIIDQLDAEGSRDTVVAKDNNDFAAMLPAKYEQLVMTRNIGGVYFKGGVIINVEKHDTTDSVLAAYEHEYAHKATREIHSNEQLADMWVNSSESDKRLLRSAYADNPDWVKGDELISLAVEDIIEKQGYQNYKSGNIDLSSYSETLQEPLKQTIEYANKEYLDNLRRRNAGGDTPSGDNAGEGNGDLRYTDGGRSASALGREDNGAAGQSPSDVSGAVSGGSEGVLQSPLNPPQGDLLPATIEVDGVERSTSNSLGQPIHPTEAGVRNFWKWFGNSKVVDKQDRPLVVYHGSISDLNEFKLIDSDVFGTKFGHFFTPDKDIAQIFADRAENGVLYATYLKLEHPKKINGFFWDSYSRYKGADASLRKQSPKEYKAGVELPDFKAFREQLQAEGNDGVVLNNISIQGEKTRIVKTPQYIVFDSTQIKSATGNNGEFGADDADIRYQIIGEKGAGALDASTSSATEATSRLDNLRVAKEMENGKSIENGRLKFFDEIPDELKNDARIVNRGEDTDGEAMKRIQANPQAKAAWVDYVKAQKDLIEWNNLPKNEQAKRIRLATGWEKGVDGLWRYEIDDLSQMDLKPIDLSEELINGKGWFDGTLTLGDLFRETELFKSYPELKDIKLSFGHFDNTKTRGTYDRETKTIYLPAEALKRDVLMHSDESAAKQKELSKEFDVALKEFDSDKMQQVLEQIGYESEKGKSGFNLNMSKYKETAQTLIHEIQHAIQDIEGFAKGGSPDKMGRYTIEENKKILEQKYSHLPSYKQAKENGELDKWVIDMVNATGTGITPHEAYKRLAGETEARNASARMNMSEEERRNTLLAETADVAPEDQIVLMDGLGVSESSHITPQGDLPATIKVDGVERPTTNSNGKPIHGTEEGIRNFWKWFGDSKVVDKDGRPLVVYHGTPNGKFNVFEKGEFGFHFGTEEQALKMANKFSMIKDLSSEINPYIHEVYLQIENPIYSYSDTRNWEDSSQLKRVLNGNGSLSDEEAKLIDWNEDSKSIKNDLIDFGYDGIKYENSFEGKGKSYIVFDPNQIKSATVNSGEFDPEDADIRFQIQTPNPQTGAKYKGSRTTPEYYRQAQSLDDLFGIGKPVHDKKGGEPISEYYKRVKAWSVANNPQAWGEADRQEAADYIAGKTPDSYEAKAQAAQSAAQAAGATVVDEPKPVFQQYGHSMENVTDFARRVVAWREQRFINGIVRAEREAEAREAVAEGFTPMDHEIARMELDMQLRTVYDSLGKLIGKQPAKWLEQRAGNKEMWADSLLPVKTFLDYMRSRGVKIPDIDDYYLQATALQGKNDTGFNNYVRKYQKPVNKWIHDTMKATGFDYRDIENYVFLKHGVERNEYFKKDGKHQRADYAGVYAIATELYAKDNGIPFNPKEKNEIGKVLKEYANANGITLKETTESGIYDELFANKKEAVEQAQVEINRAFFDKIVTDYISNFESESNGKGRSIDDFWAKLNDANNFSLDTMADAGIITRTQADEIKSRYQYFIPLRGHEVEAEKTYEYSPDAGVFFSNPAIKATGRISRAEHPFSYIAQMAQSAVVMKNNNDLKKTMLRLARKDKTGLFSVNRTWYIKTGTDAEGKDIWEEAEITADEFDELNRAEWEAWNERMKELEKEGRAKQFTKGVDLDGLFIKKKQKKQHAITVIENGEEYQVYINANPRISRAINGLNKSKQSKEMQFLSSIKGTIGLNLTSRNPAFMAANFSRDVIFASSILPAKEGGAYTAQFLANIPVAAKELIQYQLNPDKAPQHVQEFLDNGGETGYSHLWELQDMQKQIDKAVAQGMSVSKAWDALVMPIDVMNKIVENTTRLAVYKTSRENGRTVERSVSDAKEVSLNFNRTGAGGGIVDYVRGAYLFVNAGVQALSNFTKVYKEHPWKMTAVVMSYMMSGLLMSLINGMLLQLSGDDEDEYWNLPEYERQNNLCIWVGSGFVKIPLPQELRVFHRMGDNVAAHLWNKKPLGEAMVNTGAGLLDLIPANPSGPITDSWAEGMPDAVKPFFQVWANKTFTGAAIAKDESFMKAGVPQWRQVRTNRANEPKAPAGIIWLSAELNAALGGDQYRSAGAFEKAVLNPDKLNHLARGYFGGVYTTASSIVESVTNKDILKGVSPITDRFYIGQKDLEEKTIGGNLQNAYKKIDESEERVNQFKQIVEDWKDKKIDTIQFVKDTVNYDLRSAKEIKNLGTRLRDINKVLKENQDLPEDSLQKYRSAQQIILKLIENTELKPIK